MDASVFATRTYQQGPQRLIAACDVDLLGQSAKDGKLVIDVRPAFYDGDRVEADELRGRMMLATVGNLVGPQTIAIAIEAGLVDEASVMNIGGIEHAQFMLMMS